MTLLEVRDLTVRFGESVVVDGVSFDLDVGGRLGIIGESGSGKTLTALSVIGLTPEGADVSGSIRFDGTELIGRSDRQMSELRGDDITMVFQSPLTSLNPLQRVGRQIAEPLRLHHGLGRRAAADEAVRWCHRVGLPDPEHAAQAFPHQLSGGQRQRIGIAIALACRPRVLIADEPTTALDVTVQREVLDLLDELIAAEADGGAGTALLFITHDVALVSQVARQLLVMRAGKVVERGDVGDLVDDPQHAYTKQLIAAARATGLDDQDPDLLPNDARPAPSPDAAAFTPEHGG